MTRKIAKNNRVEEANEFTLTTNSCIKNKIPDKFDRV